MREVLLEDIGEVAIVRRPISFYLPVGGHFDILPGADIIGGFIKIHGTLLRPGNVVEFPDAVEALAIAGSVPIEAQGLLQAGIGHEGSMKGLLVDAETAGVFDLGRNSGGVGCDDRGSPGG